MTVYPDGYSSAMVTLDQMKNKHGGKMHPEYARRFFAYIEYKNGLLGVGGGWRATQPVKPGFAPPGKSFHESQTFASGQSKYAAVDLVCPVPNKVHRSPTWAECEDAPLFGLHTFIDGEPWHIQCIEMRGYDSWVKAGRPDPPLFPLPGGSKPDPIPPTTKGNNDMIRADYGVPGTDTWWARMLIAGNTITWVQGHANDDLDKNVPAHTQVKNDQHMLDILSTFKAMGPPPSTWASNMTLTGAWQASAMR